MNQIVFLLSYLIITVSSASLQGFFQTESFKAESNLVHRLDEFEIVSVKKRGYYTQNRKGSQQYPENAHVNFEAFGRKFDIQLEKFHDLFSPNYRERRLAYDENHKLVSSTSVHKRPEDHLEWNCFYKGHPHQSSSSSSPSLSDAKIVLHTCYDHAVSGMLNVVHNNNDNGEGNSQRDILMMEPAHHHIHESHLLQFHKHLEQGRRKRFHALQAIDIFKGKKTNTKTKLFSAKPFTPADYSIVYLADDVQLSQRFKEQGVVPTCGVHHGDSEEENDHSLHDHILQRLSPSPLNGDGAPSSQKQHDTDKGAPHHSRDLLVYTEKYVELLVVNDYARYLDLSTTTETESAAITAYVTTYYDDNTAFDPPITVTLVAQDTFVAGDAFAPVDHTTTSEISVADYLSDFHSWRVSEAGIADHDNAQLYSGYDFEDGVVGYAGVGTMCTYSASGGINQATPADFSNAAIASTVSHEMGHNFGMSHDGSGNACSSTGDMMASSSCLACGATTSWSSCSGDYLLSFFDTLSSSGTSSTCIDDTPTELWGDPVCGNGFVEDGEECDCGETDCTSVSDNCCDGSTCMFEAGAVCNPTNNACCTSSCGVESAGVECRAAVNSDCDIAETCDGSSADCPANTFYGTGNSCDTGAGGCYDGDCITADYQCSLKGSFTPCSDDSPSDNDYCSILTCETGGSCYQFSDVDSSSGLEQRLDGTPCGDAGYICYAGSCVAGSSVNTYQWASGDWSVCYSCDEYQSRDVSCEESSTVYSDDLCSADFTPSGTQLCVNDAIGCTGEEEEDNCDFYGTGWEIGKNGISDECKDVNGFVAFLIGAVFILICVCCYLLCRTVPDNQPPEYILERRKKRDMDRDLANDQQVQQNTKKGSAPKYAVGQHPIPNPQPIHFQSVQPQAPHHAPPQPAPSAPTMTINQQPMGVTTHLQPTHTQPKQQQPSSILHNAPVSRSRSNTANKHQSTKQAHQPFHQDIAHHIEHYNI